jgi:hypothetical protein
MIVKNCIIIIDEKYTITKSLDLTSDFKKALIIHGKHNAKKTLLLLEKYGVRKAKLKVLP